MYFLNIRLDRFEYGCYYFGRRFVFVAQYGIEFLYSRFDGGKLRLRFGRQSAIEADLDIQIQ